MIDAGADDGPKPPPDTYYAGPKLLGLSGHFAYFDRVVLDGAQEVKIGEKGGTVELLRVLPPFRAVVKWQAQEWTLNLLESKPIYAANPMMGSGGADGFGAPNPSRMNPFTNRGSSPNSNALFQEAHRQDGGRGSPRGGAVPQRPSASESATEN